MTTYYTAKKVFTAKSETDFATAFAIKDGSFTWVGDSAEVPANAEVVDLGDSVVLPGLLDVHTHATYVSMMANAVACTVPVVTDIPSMLEALRKHPAYGGTGWIQGWGYDESKLAEHRTPTRHDLDKVSTEQPIYVMRSDCHSGICNTRALELAGITKDTPDPDEGTFGREPNGTPNGVLTEHGANEVVRNAMGSAGFDADVQSLVHCNQHFLSRGLVGVTDMYCVNKDYDHRDLFQAALDQGFQPSCAYYLDFATLDLENLTPVTQQQLQGQTRLAGIKLFADGSMSNRTAWLRSPYPGTDNQFGMSTAPKELMQAALNFARPRGLQIAFHAMGDRAIESVIEFYENEEPWVAGGYPSVRIEHATLIDRDLMQRANRAKMNFGVASNVDFFYAEYDSYVENLRPEQFATTYAVRDLYENMEACALTSDCPATTWADPDDPFMSMGAAVTRKAYNGRPIVPEQAITIAQAVMMYTKRATKLVNLGQVGQIHPGFEGSFVVLSQDIFTVAPEEIKNTQVNQTWLRGQLMFDRQQG